jgi:hypothetical protein
MKDKLYLETSVARFLVSKPKGDVQFLALQKQAQRWWECRLSDFDVFVSEKLISDLASYRVSASDELWRKLESLSPLQPTAASEKLSRALLEENVLPADAEEAASHIAVAAIHDVKFLISQDYRHVANAHFRRKIQAVCSSQGFECPVICTPPQLMGDFAEDDPIVAEVREIRHQLFSTI